jgi:hypothetical protein
MSSVRDRSEGSQFSGKVIVGEGTPATPKVVESVTSTLASPRKTPDSSSSK